MKVNSKNLKTVKTKNIKFRDIVEKRDNIQERIGGGRIIEVKNPRPNSKFVFRVEGGPMLTKYAVIDMLEKIANLNVFLDEYPVQSKDDLNDKLKHDVVYGYMMSIMSNAQYISTYYRKNMKDYCDIVGMYDFRNIMVHNSHLLDNDSIYTALTNVALKSDANLLGILVNPRMVGGLEMKPDEAIDILGKAREYLPGCDEEFKKYEKNKSSLIIRKGGNYLYNVCSIISDNVKNSDDYCDKSVSRCVKEDIYESLKSIAMLNEYKSEIRRNRDFERKPYLQMACAYHIIHLCGAINTDIAVLKENSNDEINWVDVVNLRSHLAHNYGDKVALNISTFNFMKDYLPVIEKEFVNSLQRDFGVDLSEIIGRNEDYIENLPYLKELSQTKDISSDISKSDDFEHDDR